MIFTQGVWCPDVQSLHKCRGVDYTQSFLLHQLHICTVLLKRHGLRGYNALLYTCCKWHDVYQVHVFFPKSILLALHWLTFINLLVSVTWEQLLTTAQHWRSRQFSSSTSKTLIFPAFLRDGNSAILLCQREIQRLVNKWVKLNVIIVNRAFIYTKQGEEMLFSIQFHSIYGDTFSITINAIMQHCHQC